MDKQTEALLLDRKIESALSAKGVRTPEEIADIEEMIGRQTQLVADLGARPKTPEATPTDEGVADKGLSNRLAAFLDVVENDPVIRKSGYVSETGGSSDKSIKNLGDFVLALKRGDTERMVDHYGSRPDVKGSERWTRKDMVTSSGTTPFLIPQEFLPGILEIVGQTSKIRPRCMVVPVGASKGSMVALDQTFIPTAGVGQTALAGQLVVEAIAEAATFPETQPEFSEVIWDINKMGGIIPISNETLEDSPISVESILNRVIGTAMGAKEDYMAQRGVGSNEWLGVLNSAVAIGITPAVNNQVSWADIGTMESRAFSPSNNPFVYMYHPSLIPDFNVFEVGTGGAVWRANPAESSPRTIDGWERVSTQHLPQADNSGALLLADWSSYIIFDRAGLSLAVSTDAEFQNDKTLFRFRSRSDGMPWLKAAVTLADPQGSFTQSPFVFHND